MLKIKKSLLEQIIQYCQREKPREACGILSGVNSEVRSVYFLKNTSENPRFCYLVDPKEQIKVFKEIRQKPEELLAIFHSHIDAPAYPSPRDCELAFYPDAVYLIISFRTNIEEVRGFLIREKQITEVEIEILPE